MQIIVDEIDPRYCPFYVSESWPNTLHIAYEEGSCRLDTSPVADGLQQWSCHAKKEMKNVLSALPTMNLRKGWNTRK